jgi:4-cresol dehydrogenase (hydroxylating)
VQDETKRPLVVDALRRLALARNLPANVHMVNDVLFAAQLTQYPYDLLDGQTYLSGEGRIRLREKFKIAPWTVTGGLYGSPAQVRASRRAIRSELGGLGRVTFLNDRKLRLLNAMTRIWKRTRHLPILPALFRFISGASLEKAEAIPNVYPILKGIPGERIVTFAYFKNRAGRPAQDVDPARDGAGMLWLAALCPLTGRHTDDLLAICEPIFHKHGFDLSLALMMVNARSVLALIEIFYDKQNAEEGQRALALYDEVTAATIKAGFQQYRTSIAYSDRIMQPAAGVQHLLDAMRSAIDPGNIIAPGRYGIGLQRERPAERQ